MSDIDFFVRDHDMIQDLKTREEIGVYPPRFHAKINCSERAELSQAKFEFIGATQPLVFDVPLRPEKPYTAGTYTSNSSQMT